ncbi:hypothetical protein EOL96_03480 [Candidatus Saccharibacteria bacterium]|nr:hypothetical protein [Candidatus Saccharibacteria bacterium]
MSENSEIVEDMLRKLNQGLNHASAHEYNLRKRNNELYDLTQSGELTLDMLTSIDKAQADKARSILLGHSEANPWAVTAVNSMMTTLSDDAADNVEKLARVLEELVEQRSGLDANDPRHEQITVMIGMIEKMLVAHATATRVERGVWWV